MKRFSIAVFLFWLSANAAWSEIAIAVVGPMKGPNGVFGTQMKRGAAAAVETINAAGGINGELLRLEVADDGCDAKQAVLIAQELIAKDVRFVAGHFCSGATLAAAKTYEDAGVLMISPSASLPAVTENARWNVNRLASRDDAQADFAVARIKAKFPLAKVALLDDGSVTMAALTARFKTQFGAGLYVVAFKGGAETYKGLVKDLQVEGIGLVYFACAAGEAGKIAAEMRAAGLDAQLMGGDGLLVEDYWRNAGEGGNGTLASFTSDPILSVPDQSVLGVFRNTGFEPEGATLPSYAAVQGFAAAARASDVNNGQLMAAWLRAGNSFETIMGPRQLDVKGDVSPANFVWYQWRDGKYSLEATE